MEDEELQYAMALAEKLCAKVYSVLSEEDKNDKALIVALIWTAIAVGLKSEIDVPILRVVVQYATESALEEYIPSHETIH